MCAKGVPRWIVDSLLRGSDRPSSESESRARKRCRDNVNILHFYPDSAPDFHGPALEVSERDIQELSSLDLFHIFARHGRPVVVRGLNGNEEWKTSRQHVVNTVNASIDSGSNGHATICQSHICKNTPLPFTSLLRSFLFNFPSRVPLVELTALAIFHGATGDRFGGPDHFDQTCNPVISIQWGGTKRWTLWGPSGWPVAAPAHGGNYAIHQRMETTLHEGDAIIFFPGWYHTTHIVNGPSFSTSNNIHGLPPYDALHTGFATLSPLGYGECERGWTEMSQQWRHALNIKGEKGSCDAKDSDNTN